MSNRTFKYLASIGHVRKDDNNDYLKLIYSIVLNKSILNFSDRRHKECNTFLMYSDKTPNKSFLSGMENFVGCWSQVGIDSRNGMRKGSKIKLYVVRLKGGIN